MSARLGGQEPRRLRPGGVPGQSLSRKAINPAVVIGDPNENRTRVIGVREHSERRNGSQVLAIAYDTVTPGDAQQGRSGVECRNFVLKLEPRQIAAEAALGAYLRSMADELAGTIAT